MLDVVDIKKIVETFDLRMYITEGNKRLSQSVKRGSDFFTYSIETFDYYLVGNYKDGELNAQLLIIHNNNYEVLWLPISISFNKKIMYFPISGGLLIIGNCWGFFVNNKRINEEDKKIISKSFLEFSKRKKVLLSKGLLEKRYKTAVISILESIKLYKLAEGEFVEAGKREVLERMMFDIL